MIAHPDRVVGLEIFTIGARKRLVPATVKW